MQREKTVKPQSEKTDKATTVKRLLKQGKDSKKGGQKA